MKVVVSAIAAIALGVGGLQALAAAGVMQTDVIGVVSDQPRTTADQTARMDPPSAPGRGGPQDKGGHTRMTDDVDRGADDAGAAKNEANGPCKADRPTHGCAVSTSVHKAQGSTPSGPDRGAAVSKAVRSAGCSMLPSGAQQACARKAVQARPPLERQKPK